MRLDALQFCQSSLLDLLRLGVHLSKRLDSVQALAQAMHGVDQGDDLRPLEQVRVPLRTGEDVVINE